MINNMWAGEPITFQYSPAAAFQVSGITQDFRGANNYRPNITCDPRCRRTARPPTSSTGTAS